MKKIEDVFKLYDKASNAELMAIITTTVRTLIRRGVSLRKTIKALKQGIKKLEKRNNND